MPVMTHSLWKKATACPRAATDGPVSNLMFSLDDGRTWRDHCVISERGSFNFTSIREISPGRLLDLHDGPNPGTLSRINSLYIDVELLQKYLQT